MKRHRWHRFIFWVLSYFAGPVVKLLTGFRCRRSKGPDAPALIIANHNTNLDPALVGMCFSRQMYFVISEHALRKGLSSKLLRFVFDPIPINKMQTDASAIKEMLRRLKAGYSVCLFAEGNRSYTGVTGPVPPATAKLARISGADLITVRLRGGYLSTPRWAARRRKGRITGEVAGRYAAADLKAMTNGEVLRIIERDIHEDAYQRQRENPIRFRGKNLAEHIEVALYLCPKCQKIGTVRSAGDSFSCGCGLRGKYLETGFLEGDFLPFSTVADWDKWQSEQLVSLVKAAGDRPICADARQRLFAVKAASGGALLGEGLMQMDRNVLTCAGRVFPLAEIDRFAIVDQMTLLFSTKAGNDYEVRSETPRSASKYLEIFRILCD